MRFNKLKLITYILFWIGVIFFIILVDLIVYYFNDLGLLFGNYLLINKKEDSIQFGILIVAILTAFFVYRYVYYTRKQFDAISEQCEQNREQNEILKKQMLFLYKPILKLSLPYIQLDANDRNKFEKSTNNSNDLIIRFILSNLTYNRCKYTLKIIPYIYKEIDFNKTVKFEDSVNDDYSREIIDIKSKETYDGIYVREIQPNDELECGLLIDIKKLTNYIKKYMLTKKERFGLRINENIIDEPFNILLKYTHCKSEEHKKGGIPIQPDPIWLKFEIESYNSFIGKEDTLDRFEALYYFKVGPGPGSIIIELVKEFA
jgi:hypothetical protein